VSWIGSKLFWQYPHWLILFCCLRKQHPQWTPDVSCLSCSNPCLLFPHDVGEHCQNFGEYDLARWSVYTLYTHYIYIYTHYTYYIYIYKYITTLYIYTYNISYITLYIPWFIMILVILCWFVEAWSQWPGYVVLSGQFPTPSTKLWCSWPGWSHHFKPNQWSWNMVVTNGDFHGS
jgi:hypothetical protein